MADTTIGGLSEAIPNKSSAIIPFSDGSTTYKTSPSGIVAASPGCVLQVKQVVKTSINICSNPTINTYLEIDSNFRTSITPTNINNRIIHTLCMTGGSDTGTPRGLIQYSTNNGVNWANMPPFSESPTGADGGSGSTLYGGSRQPAHFFTATLGDANQLYTISFTVMQSALTTTSTHLYRLLLGGDRTTFYYWNRSVNYNNSFLGSRGISTWTVQEIAG